MTITALETWIRVSDGDPRAVALYRRHYSCDKRFNHRNGIGGPGERMVLLTPECDALFVWRLREHHPEWASRGYSDGNYGVCCTVFRNEGQRLSSKLVLSASERAWDKWPGARLFTYVDGSAIASVNPGYCFKQAGWRACGTTKGGLHVLERLA